MTASQALAIAAATLVLIDPRILTRAQDGVSDFAVQAEARVEAALDSVRPRLAGSSDLGCLKRTRVRL
jgi:hypothetical protein